jgi:hypothetical protein
VRPSQNASGGKSENSGNAETARVPLDRFHGDLRDLVSFGSGPHRNHLSPRCERVDADIRGDQPLRRRRRLGA